MTEMTPFPPFAKKANAVGSSPEIKVKCDGAYLAIAAAWCKSAEASFTPINFSVALPIAIM
jgi:hypothetical protein